MPWEKDGLAEREDMVVYVFLWDIKGGWGFNREVNSYLMKIGNAASYVKCNFWFSCLL